MHASQKEAAPAALLLPPMAREAHGTQTTSPLVASKACAKVGPHTHAPLTPASKAAFASLQPHEPSPAEVPPAHAGQRRAAPPRPFE